MDTVQGWIVAAMRLKKRYAQKLPVPRMRVRFLITMKESPLQTGHKDFKQYRRKNPGYFVIVNWSEECMILIVQRSQNHVFHSHEEKEKRFEKVKMEEVKL